MFEVALTDEISDSTSGGHSSKVEEDSGEDLDAQPVKPATVSIVSLIIWIILMYQSEKAACLCAL